MTAAQAWQKFVKDGFICKDMDGARRAFQVAYDMAQGKSDDLNDESATRKRIDEEIQFIWCDDYTDQCLMKIGIGKARKQQMIEYFASGMFAKMETHPTLQLAREHFINWANIMKNKVDGTDKQVAKAEWQDDIISRISRLTSSNS